MTSVVRVGYSGSLLKLARNEVLMANDSIGYEKKTRSCGNMRTTSWEIIIQMYGL